MSSFCVISSKISSYLNKFIEQFTIESDTDNQRLLNKYNNQYSYNINTALYNELRDKYKDIQGKLGTVIEGRFKIDSTLKELRKVFKV